MISLRREVRMEKRIVLCADDYGQGLAISKGIIDLLERGRLSATSCLVNMPDWKAQAAWLKPWLSKLDIGLHFNLTLGSPLSQVYRQKYGEVFRPLSWLLPRSLLHILDKETIKAECHAQLDAFIEILGCPSHIDGHQHIQQFPIVREALLEVYTARFKTSLPYIRCSLMRGNQSGYLNKIKKITINSLGGQTLLTLLEKQNFPHNPDFSGVYAFKTIEYSQIFRRFLEDIRAGGIIMCHPGLPQLKDEDTMALTRWHEYQYLMSDAFLTDCRNYQVVVHPFRNC
jgi:chitin disaccharide deacetylase